jgi:hypothetical protein
LWDVYVRHAVFIEENVKCNGEMTNAYEMLVGNFRAKEYPWEDNMKMDSRQT